MFSNKIRFGLYWKIFVLVAVVAAICLLPVVFLIDVTMYQALRQQVGRQSLATARTVSEMPEVRAWVGRPGGEVVIQPLAEGIRRRTGFDFVVVIDTNSVRYSHPEPDRIGQRFVGGDEGRAFLGEEYTSQAVGTLGLSLRSFAPIFDARGQVIGAVAVGGLMPAVQGVIAPVRSSMTAAVALGVLVAAAGGGMLSRHIKKTLFDMEPSEIASALYGREAILQSVREGVIAVDQHGVITLANDVAKDYLECDDEVVGQPIDVVLPSTRLVGVLQSAQPEYDQQQLVGRTPVLTNRVPMLVQGKVIGAVATFRDQSDISRLAEELSGVRGYLEALRVQAHDFSNRLHTISGLLQLGSYHEAVDYIHASQGAMNYMRDLVSPRIADQGVAAIILGKIGRAQELAVKFTLSSDSFLETLEPESRQAVMVIVGNLLDNAMESLVSARPESAEVSLLVRQELDHVSIVVEDNGPGVERPIRDRIFDAGVSTKSGRGRGLGLHVVKQIIDSHAGFIRLSPPTQALTRFSVHLPLRPNPTQYAICTNGQADEQV